MNCNCEKAPEFPTKAFIPGPIEIPINFRAVTIPADQGDDRTNPPLNGAYRNVVLKYAANGHTYIYSSDGIPIALLVEVGDIEFNEILNRPKYDGSPMTSSTDIPDLTDEVSTLESQIQALATDFSYKGSVADYAHLPSDAATGDVYTTTDTGIIYVWDGNAWVALNEYPDAFTGTDGTNAGVEGLVPAPAAADAGKVLGADGGWVEKEPATIVNAGAPTSSTAAVKIGQQYYDSTNSKMYYCSAITAQGTTPETYTYTWSLYGPNMVQTIIGRSTTDAVSQDAIRKAIYTEDIDLGTMTTGIMVNTDYQGHTMKYACGIGHITGFSSDTSDKGTSFGCAPLCNGSVLIGAGTKNDPNYMSCPWSSPKFSVAIGSGAKAFHNNNVVIGNLAESGTNSGYKPTETVVIGDNAKAASTAQATGSVAIGAYSGVESDGSIALGIYSKATVKGEVAIGVPSDSSGSEKTFTYNNSGYRLLTGVYDPQNSHDAATKGYVDARGITLLSTADYDTPSGNPTSIDLKNLAPGIYRATEDLNVYQPSGTVIPTNSTLWILAKNGAQGNGAYAIYEVSGQELRFIFNGVDHGWFLTSSNIKNDLNTWTSGSPLDAVQGRILNDKIEDRVKSGSGMPTSSTVGSSGTIYEDVINGKLYVCTGATPQGTTPETYLYTWEEIGIGNIPVITMTSTDPGEGGSLAANSFIAVY